MPNIYSADQKQQKRSLIMDAALTLFQKHSYPDITMKAIADQAGVAKGTTFHYFATKEDLFMTILLESYQHYFESLIMDIKTDANLSAITLLPFMEQQTQRLVREHAAMLRLNSLRGPILEGKANMAETVVQRNRLYAAQNQLGQTIYDQVGPLLSPAEFGHLFLIQSGIISGIMNMHSLNQFNHQPLLEQYQNFDIKVVQEATRQIRYYLKGYLNEFAQKG